MGLWALFQTPRTLPIPLLILAPFLTKETRWASQVTWWWRNLPASAGDTRVMGWIPGSGRFLGEQNGNPLQYSCLENSMDRGAWKATVHGAAKSQTRLSNWAPTHKETRYCNRDFQQPSHTLPHFPPALSPGSNSLILSKKKTVTNYKTPRDQDKLKSQRVSLISLLLLNHVSRVRLCDPTGGSPPGSRSWHSPAKNTGVGCHFLLQCMKVKSQSEVALLKQFSNCASLVF